MSETKTLDQERASHAWQIIEQVVVEKEDVRRQFGIQLKKLPTRIMAAGLGQALAFLHAKKYAPALLAALDDWMLKRRPTTSIRQSLLERIITGDADFQRYATAEVLAYLLWLGRFGDARDLTKTA